MNIQTTRPVIKKTTLIPQHPATPTTAQLTWKDVLGTCKVRWGIQRMNYKVAPGLYAIGTPDSASPVLVTANYKLTFDALRKELNRIDAWILVLDTHGVNVWCAAGKGTFGTSELVSRIKSVALQTVVTHKTVILPQLGAPGIQAHQVLKQSGFKVIYGPVRASDLPEYLNSGQLGANGTVTFQATKDMRNVRFTAYDRLVLTPVELVGALKLALPIFGVLFLLNLVIPNPFGLIDFYGYMGAILSGCVLAPFLLPWIPGRAFAWKGWLIGMIWAFFLNVLYGWPEHLTFSPLRTVGYLLLLPAISGYYTMNFTGASTFTSLSGVQKEMKIAVPLLLVFAAVGVLLVLISSMTRFMPILM